MIAFRRSAAVRGAALFLGLHGLGALVVTYVLVHKDHAIDRPWCRGTVYRSDQGWTD
jgi:hypothetical protein